MRLEDVTPLILTYNEAANIGRTLSGLNWARRIVVVDSGSTDSTLEILRQHGNVDVFQRQFDTHARQWNFGLSQIATEFVLSLDADYVVGHGFRDELESLDAGASDGWWARFHYCINGRPLRGSLLPRRIVLFRVRGAEYRDDGHTQRLIPPTRLEELQSAIFHDDRKPLERWLDSQRRYVSLEVQKLLSARRSDLGWPDRLRLHYLAPVLVLPYSLLAKGLILDGVRGWFYAAQRLYAELLLALYLFECRHPPSSVGAGRSDDPKGGH